MGRLYRRFINAHKFGVGSPARPAIYRASGESALKLNADFMLAEGYFVGLWMTARLNLAGYGSVYGIRGQAEVPAGITMSGGTGFIIGVHGRISVAGTINNANIILASVLGQILGGGTFTAASHLCNFWGDWQGAEAVHTALETEFLYLTNNQTNLKMDRALFIHGGGAREAAGITSFAEFEACIGNNSFVHLTATGKLHGGDVANIRITVDGVEYWMIASTAPVNA